MIEEGRKDDKGKPRYSLIPVGPLREVAEVFTFGAGKYAPDNWMHVEGWQWRYLDAMLRHIEAYRDGEWADPESGRSHLSHAVCCGLMLLGRHMSERARTFPITLEAPRRTDSRSV